MPDKNVISEDVLKYSIALKVGDEVRFKTKEELKDIGIDFDLERDTRLPIKSGVDLTVHCGAIADLVKSCNLIRITEFHNNNPYTVKGFTFLSLSLGSVYKVGQTRGTWTLPTYLLCFPNNEVELII